MNWYYIRSEVDGKPVWIKKSKAPNYPLQPDTLQILKEPLDGSIVLDPKDFQEYDTVEVTHQPPIEPGDCIPFEELVELLKNTPRKPFRPYVYFNEHCPGGMLEILWKDTDTGYYVSYPDSATGHLALCKSFENDEVVGVKVEGLVSLKLQANPD